MAEKAAKTTSLARWVYVALGLITAIAALLRFWGLRWGLPNSLHDFTYHPDEIFQVATMINIFKVGLDPGFYNYPSGYMNLGAAVLKVAAGYGMSMDSMTVPYLVARVVTAAMGVLTVPVVFDVGNRFFGRNVGLLSALLMAVMPLHLVHSHFATVDVPATLWVAVALLGAALIFSRTSLSVYLLAGAAAGFAAGTKYNNILVLIPIITAHFARESDEKLVDRLSDARLWFVFGAAILGFIVATPGWLIWPGKFVSGLTFELHHAASGHGLVFVGRGPGWFDVLTNSLGYGMGVFLLVLTLCAVGYAAVRRTRQDWVLLSFLIPYFLMISFSEVRFARYAIPMLPVIAVLVARMAEGVHGVLDEQNARFLKWVWVGICTALIWYTATYAIAFDGLFSQTDPRDRAAEWLSGHVKEGATIGLPTVPWFYSPPYSKSIIGIPGRDRRAAQMSLSPFTLVTNPEKEWDADYVFRKSPDFVIVSDYESDDVQRLRKPDYEAFERRLIKDYQQVNQFSKTLTACGIDFGKTRYLPHDLKYMAPTIRVYRRR